MHGCPGRSTLTCGGHSAIYRWKPHGSAERPVMGKLGNFSSMKGTPERLESVAEKGAMYWPAYGLMPRESMPGTMQPLEAEMRPKMPIIARRPLLISARRDFSFASGDIFDCRPKGSKSSSGTGCGMPPLLNDGKAPGLPPRM